MKPLKIGVIDDSTAMIEVYKIWFRDYDLRCYLSPIAFLEDFNLGVKFDIIITDAVMPYISGIDIIRHIRSKDLDLPILMATSLDGTEYEVLANSLNADYIQKTDYMRIMGWIREVGNG